MLLEWVQSEAVAETPDARADDPQDIAEFTLLVPQDFVLKADVAMRLLASLRSVQKRVAFEVIGTSESVSIQLACAAGDKRSLIAGLRAYLPTVKAREEVCFLAETCQAADEEFIRQRLPLDQARLGLIERSQAAIATTDWIEPTREVILFCSRAADYFRDSRRAIRRLTLETVGSNPLLAGKVFSIEAKKPFVVWPDKPAVSEMWTLADSNR